LIGGCAEVVPQLYVFFFAQFPYKKPGSVFAFFLFSSNRNRGKAFAVLSKKNGVQKL
jgi:hypothetical protein